MTIVKCTLEEVQNLESKTDWSTVDEMTDKDITEAVQNDPDTRLLNGEEFKRMHHCRSQKAPTKKPTTIRLNAEVLDFFKSQGKAWQTKINEVLQDYVDSAR